MSRVEPKDRPPFREAARGRSLIDRRADPHPSQAEGEESVIDEALRNAKGGPAVTPSKDPRYASPR
jgi:hypothetical protein